MSTFRVVDDNVLIGLIEQAKKRIVYVAPGLFPPVAKSLCDRFKELGNLEVTLVLDADEEVCRIGYGDMAALQEVHAQSKSAGFYVRAQPGLRVGVLLSDDQTLVWSPTPRAVEAPPSSEAVRNAVASGKPNGILLGTNPNEQIASAVCAEGTETAPEDAEIGTSAVTPSDVEQIVEALKNNPPIPVDLARITRVFSAKLQFVELKVTHSRLSQQRVSLPSSLLNRDASADLQRSLDAQLRFFSSLRDISIAVPVFVEGQEGFNRNGQPLTEGASEASLDRERNAIEREFLFNITGFGRLMERARRAEFISRVEAYKVRLEAHSSGIKSYIAESTETIVREAADLISRRKPKLGEDRLDAVVLMDAIRASLVRIGDGAPQVSWVFKEVTYEQTQDPSFRHKLELALPRLVKRRLGPWFEEFAAAKHADTARV